MEHCIHDVGWSAESPEGPRALHSASYPQGLAKALVSST